ncbi:MoeA N-terminal region -like protein [Glarea lozoyensis ATCC 20868]|uniref:MoeA N-terminal region-like protein n=1 Tax=Glarea lozoyensis (strain ATCC 20868 / MF5171) TaxID=1116229 RepID=S3D8Q7_GLAL2|nr:MoeA N-terminal region -like protein [Glarea lozoyensis ATCC 20868]EPE28381.1 MoeA N-terminal region -like protein [Glarea lozoyensis ATCC 20868]
MSDAGILKAKILVVSTTASKDPSTDASGGILTNVFETEGAGKWKVEEVKIVGDDVLEIQRNVTAWTDGENAVNLIISTGGTGFAVSDTTPEAITPLLHKQAPGLVHGMLAASLAVTPFALMSRPVAGVRNKTIIVTLPGSPKGAKENLQSILKLLPHACSQAAGADSRALHAGGIKKLEKDAGVGGSSTKASNSHNHNHLHSHGHSHGHGHGHSHGHSMPVRHTNVSENPKSNDPSLGPSRRNRSSPYPMLSVDDALKLIEEHTPSPQVIKAKVDGGLVGSVLAEDVTATEAVPAYRASIVDGYAVIAPTDGASSKGTFPVASISHATPGEIEPLEAGQITRITTGAPLPPGANSVVMVEDTVLKTLTDDGAEEKEVEILAEDVKEGENIREIGSDIKTGEVILKKGEEISAVGGELGLLASVGRAEVSIFKKPVIGVLSTGDEIVEHSRPGGLKLGEVRDCNRPTITSAIRGWGFDVVDLGIARDKPGALEETLRDALRKVDVIITSGGVSMGELDLLKPTIERSLGGTIHFGRVSMKPGKPTTFATVPVKDNSGNRVNKVIFSLPGNPVSAVVTLHLFVLPSLHHFSGVSPAGLPRISVVLEHEFRLDPQRPEYHRAIVTMNRNGLVTASSTGGQRSSKVGSLKSANALLCMPAGKETLPHGTRVDALLMGHIRSGLTDPIPFPNPN